MHHQDGSSIQQHSAGLAYPYVVVSFGDGSAGVICPNGETIGRGPAADTPDGRRLNDLNACTLALLCAGSWRADLPMYQPR
jgi:hypothetical protein